jgi:DNA-binding LacI/PurR family transcriptional regulator
MPALMRDVAKKAGVSITTVSHVLNETRIVAPDTRERVLKAIRELDYYANTSARLLVRGQSNLVGLIISDIENPFFPELIKSFERACASQQLEVLLCATNYDPGQARNAVRRMLENRARAVAVMTSQFDRELQEQLTTKNVPLVALASVGAGRNRSVIDIDWPSGIAEAVQHLYRLGHRKIALATGPQNQVSAIANRESVLKALQKLALKPMRILEGDHRPESGAEAAKAFLSVRERPTAIFCGNDRMAIGAIGMARDMGFAVPEDVSIVGSDDIWIARYSSPPLTTVRIPRDTLGQLAFDILMKMLRSQRHAGLRETLKTELIVRASTARPLTDERAATEQRSAQRINGQPESELAG